MDIAKIEREAPAWADMWIAPGFYVANSGIYQAAKGGVLAH